MQYVYKYMYMAEHVLLDEPLGKIGVDRVEHALNLVHCIRVGVGEPISQPTIPSPAGLDPVA
jgi:hypothetical protein